MTGTDLGSRRRVALAAVLALLALATAGGLGACGGEDKTATSTSPSGSPIPFSTLSASLPQGGQPVELDAAAFTTDIDNPYWPMSPGSRWVYRETDGEGGEQRVVVTVTSDTKTIMGIPARVVHDVVSENGQLVEDTYDWYAQDAAGNIWYLGEATKEYENGEVRSTAGSWEAGVDGAQPGVIVPADPHPGLTYRQEYLAGEAQDAARVLSLDEQVSVPFGRYADVLMTRDFTPLTPQLVEHKFYAPGVGPVLALTISGGSDREELLLFEPGR